MPSRPRHLLNILQYIARKLLELNERKCWVDPDSIPTSDPAREQKRAKQDNEIFQTARLINCGWFGSVVFSDYFSAILGLVRLGNNWSLNPFEVSIFSMWWNASNYKLQEIRKEDHSIFERGRGNVCSVEVCRSEMSTS